MPCSENVVERGMLLVLQGKKISCPTCRGRTKVTDVAYVDNGWGTAQGGEEGGQASSTAAQEAAIEVEGSYGTKVRILALLHNHALLQCSSAMQLINGCWEFWANRQITFWCNKAVSLQGERFFSGTSRFLLDFDFNVIQEEQTNG